MHRSLISRNLSHKKGVTHSAINVLMEARLRAREKTR